MMTSQAWGLKDMPRTSGLAEMYWALKHPSPSKGNPAHAAFRAVVERYGEPALVVGAASGGLMIDLLSRGYVVDAVEPSPVMRGYLLRLALSHELRLTVYGVPMEQMDIDRRYGSILVPHGTLMSLTDRRHVLRALNAIHRHLRPDGALAFNVQLPSELWRGIDGVPRSESRGKPVVLPASDDETLMAETRLLSLDPVDQIYAEQRVYKLYRADQLVRQEYRTVRERWYSRHEMAMMLAWAGFSEIEVSGVTADYEEPARAEQVSILMFTARK